MRGGTGFQAGGWREGERIWRSVPLTVECRRSTPSLSWAAREAAGHCGHGQLRFSKDLSRAWGEHGHGSVIGAFTMGCIIPSPSLSGSTRPTGPPANEAGHVGHVGHGPRGARLRNRAAVLSDDSRAECSRSFLEGRPMELPSVSAHRAARCVLLLLLPVLLSGMGCYMNGMGCQPGDDTETCCLKEHPGAWERCTGTAGPKTQPKKAPSPKDQPKPEGRPEPFFPPNPTPEELEEWRKRCLDYYVRCSDFVQGDAQWRVYGERQCQSCWRLCERTGQWPAEANEKPCPGGDGQ